MTTQTLHPRPDPFQDSTHHFVVGVDPWLSLGIEADERFAMSWIQALEYHLGDGIADEVKDQLGVLDAGDGFDRQLADDPDAAAHDDERAASDVWSGHQRPILTGRSGCSHRVID